MFLCLKQKEICLYVLMSKTKKIMSLCSYVRNKKDYVILFLCPKQKRLCHLCSYVQNKKDYVFMFLCLKLKRPVFMSKNLKIMSNKFDLCVRS